MSYQVTLRDRIAHRLANAVMRIATPEYRALYEVTAFRVLEEAASQKRHGKDQNHDQYKH